MPDHIKFILRHAGVGVLVALTFTGLILYFNVANIWHLVTHTAEGPIALAVFVVLCSITFGSVQIGLRIMSMGQDDDTPKGGRRDMSQAQLRPIPIRHDDRR